MEIGSSHTPGSTPHLPAPRRVSVRRYQRADKKCCSASCRATAIAFARARTTLLVGSAIPAHRHAARRGERERVPRRHCN